MTDTFFDCLSSAKTQLPVFQKLVHDIPYEPKGILTSEIFFLWLCAQAVRPTRILESGRARGQSTLVLARCFPGAEIISVEHDRNSPDVLIAAERLKNESNVDLLFGDATTLLPQIAKPGDIALIDGPKGFRGVRFALNLLGNNRLPMVFVHDAGPKTTERRFFDQHLLQSTRYSDDPGLVCHSHKLDDDEAMQIPVANSFTVVQGNIGYGYGLACLRLDSRQNYSMLRLHATLAGLKQRLLG